jgi:preprotein translocase subunit SecB
MKQQLRLKKFLFEDVEIRLPLFPGLAKRTTAFGSPSGSYTIYTSKRSGDRFAFRWSLKLKPKKRTKRDSLLSFKVTIVGIFEIPRPNLPSSRKKSLLVRQAPTILYEVVKKRLSPVISSSMLEGFELPEIDFGRVRLKES